MNDELKVLVVGASDRRNLQLRWRCPITGRTKSKSVKTTNRVEAQKAAGKLEAELRSGKYQPAIKLTWADFRDRAESEYYPTIAHHTQQKADTVLDAVERILKPLKLAHVTNERLSYFAAQLRTETIGEGEKKTLARGEATVAGYLRQLLTILRWAHDLDLLAVAPKLARAARVRIKKTGKGRAVTAEEFERMQANVEKALTIKDFAGSAIEPSPDSVGVWEFFLRGLWTSGLRLGEAVALSWSDETTFCVDMSGRVPVVRIPEGVQKSRKEETWPCPPDFAQLLAEVPEGQRRGRVFKLATINAARAGDVIASQIVGRAGKLAGVVVSRTGASKTKYASAHDLRRSFCTRWSRLVMPQVLMRLARHSSIQTTMTYYVTQSAEDTATALYAAWERHNSSRAVDAS